MHHDTQKTWYALYVRPHTEHKVALALNNLQVEHLLPLCRTTSFHTSHRRTVLEKVLFPGYVFCNVNLTHGPRLYHVPGVIQIVSRSKIPVPIPQGEIDMIRQIKDGAPAVVPYEGIVAGEAVIVVKGPLRGLQGVYVDTHPAGQLIVSFPMLCRSVNIRIDRDWVAKVTKPLVAQSQAA